MTIICTKTISTFRVRRSVALFWCHTHVFSWLEYVQFCCELHRVCMSMDSRKRVLVWPCCWHCFCLPNVFFFCCGFLLFLVIYFKIFVFVLLLFCLSRLSGFCGKSLLTLRSLIIITISFIAACMCAYIHTYIQTSQQMLQATGRQTKV